MIRCGAAKAIVEEIVANADPEFLTDLGAFLVELGESLIPIEPEPEFLTTFGAWAREHYRPAVQR